MKLGKFIPKDKYKEVLSELEKKPLINKILENPFDGVISVKEQTAIHNELIESFKIYGNIKELLKLYSPPIEGGNRRFSKVIKSYFVDEKGNGYIVVEPESSDLDKIELWHKINQIHKLLVNLKIHQRELLSVKNNLDNFQEIKRKIIGIVKEIEKLLKAPIQQLEPKKQTKKEPINQNFDTVFISEESKLQTLEAAKNLRIINDKHDWIYGTKKKAAIMAIIDVLKTRGKLKDLPNIDLANIFATKFNTTISERTTRARPKYFTDLLRGLKVLIK